MKHFVFLIFSVYICYVSSSHVHNGEDCEESIFMIDAHGCPPNIYYDPRICTGVMLNQIGAVWSKLVRNVTIGHRITTNMLIQVQPSLSKPASFDLMSKMEVYGRNDENDEWIPVEDVVLNHTISCVNNNVLCDRALVLEVEHANFSTYQLLYSFVKLAKPSNVNSVYFEFKITNCTHDISNVTASSNASPTFNYSLIAAYGGISLVVVIGLIFFIALTNSIYRSIRNRASRASIVPSASYEAECKEYTFEEDEEQFVGNQNTRPMELKIVELVVRDFTPLSTPINSPLTNRRFQNSPHLSPHSSTRK